MQFHISRSIRDELNVDELLFSYTGNIVFGDVAASRSLAARLGELEGANGDPARTINAGALFAMGLIDELSHALVARYRKEVDPKVLSDAMLWFAAQTEPATLEKLLMDFVAQFPSVDVYRGEVTAQKWLEGTTDGLPNREAALEELLLLWLANTNPAFAPFRRLFEDTGLKQQALYKSVTSAFPNYFITRPLVSPEIGSLLDALQAPALASPDSVTGQLDFIREHWAKHLGDDLRRVLLAIDVLREEDLAIWMRFHPPGPNRYSQGAQGFGSEGFVGDEYVGFDQDYVMGADGVRHRRYAADYQAPLNEYEAFSSDQAWMPNVVLVAKSTYVWLEQLSKKYGRHIYQLDHIPDEELRLLADRGITGLWLIGLWERSTASRTIKRLRGNSDAVASAYSLKDYEIARDLGGQSGYEDLKHRAAAAGLRLASDMVPNHMGIDSNWVVEHPDWFIYKWDSPFPAYRFDGPDLSSDSRVEIKIEDHYYEQTDAAVVFRLRHYADNSTRFVYHGNDGTTFAWNDTAQIDYSKAAVREHVIQTILHVARLFPIIRFDAAMVLAKRHVQRLWFPLPGAGGSIPSRAENAMSQEDFDSLMPHEFWREVVDRVATEVPGTLLLAEAFWLLEGYFVRTLGMHRVYNSAFMNMLRDEENAKYRSYLKKTIEFDPDIMKRYVNFMSNPDERTAIDQFGSGDKYFGVSTLLATLPGLPMFGHGQVEGFTERYGMDFKQARLDEWPDENLIARHQHEIAPLLKRRSIFAESASFILYDFRTEDGAVDENVFAYSNRHGDERSLILYNNRYESTRGNIHISAASMDKGSGSLRQRSLAEGIGAPADEQILLSYRDPSHGLEYIRRAIDFHWHGLSLDLQGYQCVVFVDWRELRSTAEYPWDRLCDALNGQGVASIENALEEMKLGPVHDALRHAISEGNLQLLAKLAGDFVTADSRVSDQRVTSLPREDSKAKRTKRTIALNPVADDGPTSKIDRQLDGLVSEGRLFFDRVLEGALDGNREIKDTKYKARPVSGALVPASVSHASMLDTVTSTYRSMILVALSLPSLQQHSSDKPSTGAPSIYPNQRLSAHSEPLWAPVLAWLILFNAQTDGAPTVLFDQLHLRSALAKIFAGLKFEGDNGWRAAAQVRVLLAHASLSDDPTQSAEFWRDPDVHWLLGVNDVAGKTYFNKESFEQLVAWLKLPVLLRNAGLKSARAEAIGKVNAAISAASRAAAEAGYTLDLYLKSSRRNRDADVQAVFRL